jgi:hypothetical protein
MKQYVKINYGSIWFICEVLEALSFIQTADYPKEYTFELVNLTDEEYNSLPEFGGF